MRIVKKPEERKAEMVAAASKLFAQQGFVRTSVAEIVTAVDVAKGLFYYYFTTKDDMVKAVVEGYCAYLGTLASEIAESEGSAREKLSRLMALPAGTQCFTTPLVADLCLPQHAALYTDMCDRLVAHMGPSLEKMAAQALLENGKDPSAAPQLVGVGAYGVLMMARTGKMSMPWAKDMICRLTGLENIDG